MNFPRPRCMRLSLAAAPEHGRVVRKGARIGAMPKWCGGEVLVCPPETVRYFASRLDAQRDIASGRWVTEDIAGAMPKCFIHVIPEGRSDTLRKGGPLAAACV